jgi:signal transduction histidine kinase
VTLDVSGVEPGIDFVGDERVLVQLLLNLVINAIKFSGKDRTVRIGCRRTGDDTVEFTVADRGRGMTPADAARALRPFETAADAETRRKSDTGLGLPLARMFAELHGGSLELDTAPGEGTRVRVRLPLSGPAAAPA